MKNENIKTEYQIVVNEILSDVEIARLRDVASLYGMKNVEFQKCTIRVDSDLEERELFSSVATWLSYIGAEADIFCIQRITTFYTGMTTPEVKDLMRT